MASSSQRHGSHHDEDNVSSSNSDNDETATTSRDTLQEPQDKQDEPSEKKVSCQPCREAKVKCIPSPSVSSAACTRCLKLDRPCFYRTHKRGRKPGKIKFQQILRRLELLDRTLAELSDLNKEVGDDDVDSLVETLMWQLRRSKFFDKTGNHVVLSVGEGGVKAIKREREASTLSATGAATGSGARSTPIPPTVGAPLQKGRSDFNMLVDMEDQASVARVPDEFPTLSNPLKLLAQASSEESERRGLGAKNDCERRRGSGLRVEASADDEADDNGDSADGSRASGQGHVDYDEQRGAASRKRRRSSPPPAVTTSASTLLPSASAPRNDATAIAKRTDPSTWASTYFSRGAFHPIYDNRPDFDPIDLQLITLPQATRLVSSFYASFGTFMHIFDPALSSITYIRKHSAFLLTVMCALSAEFESSVNASIQAESEGLALSLRRHYEGMIAWITSGEYKNVEMAQAFFLLASYQPMSESAMSDQTWLFLGTAIRIATELGCNLTCYSYSNTHPSISSAAREHYQRQLRNTERLWINLWNLEKTLASQTGQRMHLADEGVVANCSRWHSMDCALRQDEVLVAQVELRRIMIEKGDHFNTHVLRSLGARRRLMGDDVRQPQRNGNGDEEQEKEDPLSMAERDQLSLQLSYFRNSVSMDLKRWEERWLSSSYSASSSTPTPLQITGPLSLDYAALVTYALPLPLHYTVDVTPELAHLYRHCYISCTNYMATFIDRSQRRCMDHVTNSTVVSTVYAVVFALDLVRKATRSEGRPGVDFGFVSSNRVVNLARSVAKELDGIGGAKGDRLGRSVASKYSVFLSGVLERFEPEPGARRADQERGGVQNEREGEEVERAAVRRGFESVASTGARATEIPPFGPSFSTMTASDNLDASSRHLRRDHNHPLSHQSAAYSTAAATQSSANVSTSGATGKQGTKASHIYSSDLLFSPTPHSAPSLQQASGGWTAPALSPATPSSQAQYSGPIHGEKSFIPPHHHFPSATREQTLQQNGGPANNPALNSPASWFGHLHATANMAGGLEDDPSWEWMMKDLDFFSVDGGGGGGEPILDQMGRLFG